MNDVRTVAELEHTLRTAEPELLQPGTLTTIRAQGRRRRRARLTVAAGGVAASVVLASLLGTGLGGDGHRAHDVGVAEHPHTMSALAKRALAELPGAQQVSPWQVVIPGGGVATLDRAPELQVRADQVAAGPVDIGTRWYAGVTAFRPRDFPAWLYDGTDDYEQQVLGDENSHPVGSTDDGVIVDGGQLRLACVESKTAGDPCDPAMLSGPDGGLVYQWGMGADHFLEPGHDLQLFSTHTYTSGSPATVWIGGTDGTDVASVDLVTTDGRTVSAHVEAGSFVPGDTMFWGTVDGELAMAVTRDADGNVLEKHVVKPCDSPVDCEVR